MYYLLVYRPSGGVGIVRDPQLPSSVSFLTGSLITEPLPDPLVFTVDTTAAKPPADFIRKRFPVFSDRLVLAFQEAGVDNLQLFPALLRNPKTGEEWAAYHVVNIVGLVSCLAVAESNAESSLPPLYEFELSDMVIDESRTDGMPLFRLLESPSVILVHTQVGDRILDAKPEFRGLQFRDVASI
jgi:hypothetical protein